MVMRNWLKLQPVGRTLTACSVADADLQIRGARSPVCSKNKRGVGLGPSPRSATVQGMCHLEGYMCVVQCKVPLLRLPLKDLEMN